MQAEQPSTPYHGNLFRQIKQNSTQGNPIVKTIVASDIVLSEFQGISEQLCDIKITQMEILQKQLDKPLNPIINFFASVADMVTNHHFLLFKTKFMLISVDYYQKNRLIIRLGDQQFVFQLTKTNKKRKDSKIVQQKNGLMWRVLFNTDQFTVGKLLNLLLQLKMPDHSKLSYNGMHFSRQVFNNIQAKYVKK